MPRPEGYEHISAAHPDDADRAGAVRVAVAGGTGTVGRHVVAALQAAGHDAVVISRSTGHGLTAALHGADAVVDVSSTRATTAAASVAFFGTVTHNPLASQRAAGVPHLVALSIIGVEQVPAGYYAGKKVQEDLVMASGQGWSLLRAAQFHEFARQVLDYAKVGSLHIVPTMRSQPVAASEVGAALADIATAPRPRHRPGRAEGGADGRTGQARAAGRRPAAAGAGGAASWGMGQGDARRLTARGPGCPARGRDLRSVAGDATGPVRRARPVPSAAWRMPGSFAVVVSAGIVVRLVIHTDLRP